MFLFTNIKFETRLTLSAYYNELAKKDLEGVAMAKQYMPDKLTLRRQKVHELKIGIDAERHVCTSERSVLTSRQKSLLLQ